MTKITESARGQECAIRLPGVCNSNPATVCWSHANGIRFGKGVAKKCPDVIGTYACFRCHMVYDGQHPRPRGMTRDEVELAWWRGHGESLRRLVDAGLAP